MKSPDRKYNTNALNKYMESSDKKERNSKNSNNNNMSKTANINIKQSFKLLEQNNYNSNNLIISGNNIN